VCSEVEYLEAVQRQSGLGHRAILPGMETKGAAVCNVPKYGIRTRRRKAAPGVVVQ
jgi:hypothetical protein